MTSTINSVKQRKLTDLRVVDLQRELRSFNISYDKKELKGSLLEKLRQALMNRNIDPENYLFDTSADLKSISSDENNRNLDENGSHEANNSETSTMEFDAEQPLNPVKKNINHPCCFKVQTNSASSSTTNEVDEEQTGQTNRIDTMDLRHMVEEYDDDHGILTIDQSITTKQEDENNNDKMDPHLNQLSGFSSDEDLDNKNFPNPTRTDPQTSVDSNRGEDFQTTTTTDLSNDNDNLAKSEINRQESTDEPPKKDNTNKDQCHLWVSNIAKETHASDLKDLFSKHGRVLTTKVIGSSSSQWFGYINLATPDDVQKCINALHQTELHGKKIYVDREMHDEPVRSSTSKSNSSSTLHEKRSDYSSQRASSNNSYKKRDSITDSHRKSSTTETNLASKKRPASTSNENKKKLSTADVDKSKNDDRSVQSHELDSTSKKTNNETGRNSSGSAHSQSSKYQTARTDAQKSESFHKSSTVERKPDKYSGRSEKSSASKTASPTSTRSHSSEKHSIPSSSKSDHHRSSSIDKSKQHTPSHTASNKYDKSKETHRSAPSTNFDSDRRSSYQNDQRLRHEKEALERKQYVQHQEEEKIKEQQRRLAEEREQVRREFEILERKRLEIERTRIALEKEKQDQTRELEKQQRRLADEAKHRQQQAEAKLRDEKLHRISQNDSKRSRSSHHESQRSHHSNTNNSSSNNSHSNKGYDHRSSTNVTRGRDRSLGDTNRDYYLEPKRQYTNSSNNQREPIFHDRVVYRDSDLPTSSSAYGLNSSSMSSNNNNQRYLPLSSSNPHRPPDPYNTLPQRGRDMALPPTSSVSNAYERSSRNLGSPPTNPGALLRRPHSRERFDDREYMQQAQRRGRSPPGPNTLRREPMETSHWERSKTRDTAHYNDDSHKYLPSPYLSESSQSSQQQQQQQGLWSAAPPSRPQHHHPDLSLKAASHAPNVDPYGWQRVPQSLPSQALSSHDRARTNIPNNPRIPISSSNQPPPPPPSSRGNTAGQTHLYSHPGVPVSALSTSQHGSLAPPPPPTLHHTAAYVTQPAPPSGLVLHPTGQTRAYEPHYIVTQPLPQRRY